MRKIQHGITFQCEHASAEGITHCKDCKQCDDWRTIKTVGEYIQPSDADVEAFREYINSRLGVKNDL